MNPSDQQACRESIDLLTSDQHQTKNLLFLEPFDTSQFPGYSQKVSRPMDLATVRHRLDSGIFSTPENFWAEVDLVFINAIAYHTGRVQTKHVVKLAKEMMKLVKKEKDKRNKKLKKPTTVKLSLKLKGPSSGSDTASKTLSKVALKVPAKIPGKAAPAKAPSKILTKPVAKPGIKLSVKPPSKPQSKPLSKPLSKPPSKPLSKPQSKPAGKIKLKLNLSSMKSKSTTPPVPAPPPPPADAPAPVKIRINPAPGPRGKELPKGVASSSSSTSTAATTSSSSKATMSPVNAKPSKSVTPKLKLSAKPKKQTVNSNSKGGKADGKKGKKASTPKSTTPKALAAPKSMTAKSTMPKSSPASNSVTAQRRVRYTKVISGLRRRQQKNVVWFKDPVSDKAFVDEYKLKIPSPMDLGTMLTKVEKDKYSQSADFALDLRRIFGNCLRFNTTKHNSFRPIAVQMLKTAEELMANFVAKPEVPNQVYAPLLFCWELCINLIDRLLNVSNQSNGHQTAHYFMHPASYFFGGTFPADYLSKVTKPMDFGTIQSNLMEGNYQTINAFSSDCRLVIENCLAFYGGRADGVEFTAQANHLKTLMSQQLDALDRYDKSSNANQARAAAMSALSVRLPKPPETLLLSILAELRTSQYMDRLTKLSQPAMRPFEKPVDLTVYQDYLQYAPTPMDLETVERKVKAGVYETPEDFEYDVHLIFKNCETFNAPRKTEQMVAMGKNGTKEFRKLFTKRMKAYENPEEATSMGAASIKKRSASPAPAGGGVGGVKPAKRTKLEDGSKAPRAATPRISITASTPTAAEAVVKAKAKTPPPQKREGPVPLHVAIAEVKSRYPLRRPLKLLEEWEVTCAKFFKDLMKHSWISVARPKFIYHVPVPIIFPELKEAYNSKVKKPMDLTTAESNLFQGGLYYTPQDFIDDVALVFANAIIFNKAGRDEGDHLSVAYYDASIHLLKYTRWLSLEYFQKFLSDDPHTDDSLPDGLPPSNWKLSKANQFKAREEMNDVVITEAIDKSMEGDRFPATWMESECEKLLKALRHQSDHKNMMYFISEIYPADYTANISKPMAWERVQKNLRKRKYDKFGEVVDDLRLIFSNAQKYNAKHKESDETSRKAYDGAVIMAGKLEASIDKTRITVSDRSGKEKVDHAMEEREAEVAERAEEERVRQAIANGELPTGTEPGSKAETVETVRVVQRRPVARRDIAMEMPFFDEDDVSHEQTHVESMRQQRATFERQQRERKSLNKLFVSTGALVFAGLVQSEHAKRWADRMAKVMEPKQPAKDAKELEDEKPSEFGSKVATALSKAGRSQIKLQHKKLVKKRKRGTPAPFSLE